MHQYLDLVGLIMGQMSKDLIKHVLVMVKHVPSLLNDGCQLIRAPFPLLKLLKPSPTLIHFIKSYKIDQDYGP